MKDTLTAGVTINVTAHKEGYYLFRTLKAVEKNREFAKSRGIWTTVHINLDNADTETKRIAKVFSEKHDGYIVYENEFGDLSLSRNFLIETTKTEYILFADGDDLFSENFLAVAFQTAQSYGNPCIVSAEDIIKFSDHIDPVVFRPESTIEQPAIKSAIFETNLFISQNFVSTSIYRQIQYEPVGKNYGFEDWHWNTKAIYAGYEFLVAADTMFFYRQKPDDKSLLRQHTNSNTVIRSTELFRPDKYINLPHIRYSPSLADTSQQAQHENKVRTYGRKTAQQLLGAGAAYRTIRKIYRIVQQSAAPTIHEIRKHTHNSATVGNIQLSNLPYGLKRYELSEGKKQLWTALNSIEPLIRFDENLVNQLHLYQYTHQHALASTYMDFCERYQDEKFTDVIFVPWVNKGGADLAMIDLVRVLCDAGRKVLIFTTTGVESTYAGLINDIPGALLIQSHDEIFRHLDHKNIKIFFLRLIQNWSIETMTVMNSAIGFELVERFGRAICDTGCRIIAHNYAFPTQDNLLVDAFPSFTASLEYYDKIIVDSEIHRKEMTEIYGLEPKKITNVPLIIDSRIKEKTGAPTKRILFANRIAREKQPDIAIATAALLEKDDISLDIYGTIDDFYAQKIDFFSKVEATNNVIFKGLFESSLKLNFSDYDICFMPSLYEGTPRIVLEAVKAGLYVVCTRTGGMPEVVTSKYSGVILPITATAEEFARAIKNYYIDEEIQDLSKRRKENVRVLKEHSQEHYEQIINSIYLVKEK